MRGLHFPVGTVRTFKHAGRLIRKVKVAEGRWETYARHLWMVLNGPVPAGKKVGHRNGDQLDCSPENLLLMKNGEQIALWEMRDPAASARAHKRASAGAAKFNRERSAVLAHRKETRHGGS